MTQEEIDTKVAEFMTESVVVDSTNEAYVYNAMNALRDVAENYYRWGMEDAQEQMMKDAVEAVIEEPECLVWRITADLEGDFVVKHNLRDGDKVKVLIIKEK